MNLNDIAKKGKDEENPPNRNVLPTPLNADHSALSFLHAAYEALDQDTRHCRENEHWQILYALRHIINDVEQEYEEQECPECKDHMGRDWDCRNCGGSGKVFVKQEGK